MTPQQLDFVADAVNPALLGLFLGFCLVKLRNRGGAKVFLIRFGLVLLITYVLSHLHQWFHWWETLGDFPSGHMAFYFTVATSFFVLDRRSALLTIPLAVLYGWLIVFLGYHSWIDLLGALILAVPLTWFAHRVAVGDPDPG
ncbi:MAG: hypothetical protein ACOYMS_09330 [Terrimicrobiaceae bacterium]